MTPQISKAYKHGSRYRCRVRTASGWRWCPSADSPEGATAAAEAASQAAGEPPQDAAQDPPAQDAAAQDLGGKDLDPPPGPREPKTKAMRAAPSDGGTRIQGPHLHEGGYRYRIITSAGRTWAATAKTEAAALRIAEAAVAKAAKQGAITVQNALAAYLRYKERIGRRPESIASIRNAVTGLFRGELRSPVSRITPRVCQQAYDRLQTAVDPRSGRTLSVATHRSYLIMSRSFFRWVVDRGWIGGNPLDSVRGEGKRKKGKQQLHLDEAHRLSHVCLREALRGDAGAAATLMLLHMALRASEALSRTGRDLDQGGTVLRVCDNEDVGFHVKTEGSERSVKIPSFLQPILAARVGKLPTDPLFAGPLSGRQTRQWLYAEVRKCCARAGVPPVCPHSLRGAFATALASTGESVEVVAQLLGHESTAMTLQHYIRPGVAEAAALERAALAFTPPAPPTPSLPS